MVVEHDPHSLLPGVGDDLVHHLDRGEALQVGILGVVDAAGLGSGAQHLAGVRQPDGVEPLSRHLIDHVFVVAGPKAMRRKVGALGTEPVDAGQLNRLARRVDDLIARGTQVPGCDTTGPRFGCRRVGDAQTGCCRRRCGVVGEDGSGGHRAGEGGARRTGQRHLERLVRLDERVTDDPDVHALRGDTGGKGQRPGLGDVIGACFGGTVGRRVVHRDLVRRRLVQRDREHQVGMLAVALRHRKVGDRDGRDGGSGGRG